MPLQCLAVAALDESLSMPAAGLAPGSSNPLALPTPKANPLPGSEVDVHELVSASLAAQTDDFASAVQQKMFANIVQLVQNTMGSSLGALDDKAEAVAIDVTKVAGRFDDLSNKMDTFDVAQKKKLLQLEKLDLCF